MYVFRPNPWAMSTKLSHTVNFFLINGLQSATTKLLPYIYVISQETPSSHSIL